MPDHVGPLLLIHRDALCSVVIRTAVVGRVGHEGAWTQHPHDEGIPHARTGGLRSGFRGEICGIRVTNEIGLGRGTYSNAVRSFIPAAAVVGREIASAITLEPGDEGIEPTAPRRLIRSSSGEIGRGRRADHVCLVR